jgi:hypothetical protein
MVIHTSTTKSFLVYNHNDEQHYKVDLEIDHTNLDEELICITDQNGFEVENEETFSEIESIFDAYYNTIEGFSNEDE